MGKLLLLMLEGTYTSLKIFFLTLLFSLPLGLIVARGRMSKYRVVSSLVNGYIMIMRGTPLILQLIFALRLSSYAHRPLTAYNVLINTPPVAKSSEVSVSPGQIRPHRC